MTWRVLVSVPHMQPPVLDQYLPVFREHGIEVVVPDVRERLEEAQLMQWLPEIDGVICGDDRFTERVMRAFPRLKVISKWGTGIDSIDQAAAARLGIAVCNTPNAFTEPVADTVLGYMLLWARRLIQMDRDMRAGVWRKRDATTLRECTLGIIGVGSIGRAVARRASAFGMRLLGCDPRPVPDDVLAATHLEMTAQDRLLAEADFVSLNCDLNPTSEHLLNAVALARMQPTAFVINTARGPLIHEPALIDALRQRRIAGAALDVFEDEPLPADSPLRQFDTVFLAPHNANRSPAAARHVHENTVRNLIQALDASARRPERVAGR